MKIIKYQESYRKDYTQLVQKLWNDCDKEELNEIINEHSKGNIIYLAIDQSQVIGFLNTSIRTDYVEGASTSNTGYIEGIFVEETHRRKNIAKSLLSEAFQHFKSVNITEVGSDIELDNDTSKAFHEQVGFKEMSRNIHYLFKI